MGNTASATGLGSPVAGKGEKSHRPQAGTDEGPCMHLVKLWPFTWLYFARIGLHTCVCARAWCECRVCVCVCVCV